MGHTTTAFLVRLTSEVVRHTGFCLSTVSHRPMTSAANTRNGLPTTVAIAGTVSFGIDFLVSLHFGILNCFLNYPPCESKRHVNASSQRPHSTWELADFGKTFSVNAAIRSHLRYHRSCLAGLTFRSKSSKCAGLTPRLLDIMTRTIIRDDVSGYSDQAVCSVKFAVSGEDWTDPGLDQLGLVPSNLPAIHKNGRRFPSLGEISRSLRMRDLV
jgi:hypothetical protein